MKEFKDEKVIFNMRIPRSLRDAIRRVARQRSAILNSNVTAKDIVLKNLGRDEEVMREWAKMLTSLKKGRK